MQRTQVLNIDGKAIFRMDFTNLNKLEEIREVINEGAKFIRKQPQSSVLTLTIISDMHFSNEIRDAFKDFMNGNKPYVKSGAVVGLNGLQKIVYNGLMKVTGRDIRSFEAETEARNWLIGRN